MENIKNNKIAQQLSSNFLFLIIPAVSLIVSLSWKDFIDEYFDKYMVDDREIVRRKFILAVLVTSIAIAMLYFVK